MTISQRVEVDVDYTDCIALSIETKLVINFPRPRFAVLPISLGLTVERFSGTVSAFPLSKTPNTDDASSLQLALELFSTETSHVLPHSTLQAMPRSRHELHFSLHPDFALDASATSLVGSRAKLQDVPKIEQLLVEKLRSFVHNRFVWPKYWCLTLPNLVPRSRARSDEEESVKEGMHVAGQGDSLEDNEATSGPNQPMYEDVGDIYDNYDQNHLEFAPSFLQQQHPNDRLSRTEEPPLLPGTLPNVEAWRSQETASRLHHRPQARQMHLSKASLPQQRYGDGRYGNAVPSIASSVAYS